MKTISFVIPVYNEEIRIEKTFKALSSLQVPRGLKLEEVIFVNDGSTDKTEKKLRQFRLNIKNVKKEIVNYKVNQGKGYAVTRGMIASDSDYTLFLDADMSTDLSELKKFMPAIKQGIPVIIGTRKNGHSTVLKHQPKIRELLGKGFTLLSQIILNTWVTDFTCGFKAFSKEAAKIVFPKIRVKSWGFDAEVLFLSRVSGFECREVPVVWTDDRCSKVKIWKDLPKSLFDLFYIRIIDLIGYYGKGRIHAFARPAVSVFNVLKTYLF